MLRPEELMWMATTWRNVASAIEANLDYANGAGLTGSLILHARAAKMHAEACAEQLEERARDLEKTLQRDRGGQ